MSLLSKLLAPWREAKPAPVRKPPTLDWSRINLPAITKPEVKRAPLEAYKPAPGVVPEGKHKAVLAMDATPYDFIASSAFLGMSIENEFPGYPYLAQLAQLPEYRKITGTIAKEMTRKWLKLKSTGEGDDNADKIEQLEHAMERFHVRDCFRIMAQHDGFFGRGNLYIDVKKPSGAPAREDYDELQTPLLLSGGKIKKGSLIGFRPVEPMWMYPGLYNSTDPLTSNYYVPSTWYVMGKTVHASRFIIMMARPVPDMLKAAYSFGGVSMSQLARPYVDNWIRTRDSVSDAIHNFSITGLETDLSAMLAPDLDGTGGILKRIQLFNQVRDNRGLFLLDKEKEALSQINTPLSGLSELQAQAQEQMAAVSSIPLVKLLGISPTGLNASSDGEIRVFYDDIHAEQENSFRGQMKRLLDILQLNEFGEIDPDITFEFEPLFQLSSLELANQRKVEADTDQVLVGAGIVDAEEARTRVASDVGAPYASLDVTHGDDDEPEDQGNEAETSDRVDTERQGSTTR